MINIETNFMGLKLKNPIIVASSKLTSTVENIIECESSGASAVIVKSLFEEQIQSDQNGMVGDYDSSAYSDAWDFFQNSSEDYYVDQYIKLIEDAQKSVSIPVIPSLNCVSSGNWIEYAQRLENCGAKALELNLYILPSDASKQSADVESTYLSIIKEIKKKITIPVALKLGSHFSAMANTLKTFSDDLGVEGLVLFNRFYRSDFNIEKIKLVPGKVFSDPTEMALSLQWIALMSGELKADLVATTGVHTGTDLIKQLLAGAKAVEICSTIYQNGFEQINSMIDELKDWMQRHEFANISEFNGLLCQERSSHPENFERAQYVKALVGIQ